MSKYWSPIVKKLDPYVPGEQPKVDNLIKLNTNENPYGPSPVALVDDHAAERCPQDEVAEARPRELGSLDVLRRARVREAL